MSVEGGAGSNRRDPETARLGASWMGHVAQKAEAEAL